MRLRRRYLPLAAVLGVAVAVLPAIASSETSPTIEAVDVGLYNHAWSPKQVSIGAGGVVTLRNSTTTRHGVNWVGGPAKPTCDASVPVGTTEASAGPNWSGNCTFTQAGAYTFYCTVHGPEMTGTVTVSSSGTTITTGPTSPTTTPTGTTPSPITETPSGSPLVGSPAIHASQHGTSVRGSLAISPAGAGDRLEVDLLVRGASLAKRSAQVTVGRLVRGKVPAGRQSFAVKLDVRARRALRRRHRLSLTVRLTLTPFYGEPTTLTRAVVVHGR